MKNLFVFAIVAVGLTIFNGCQKSDEQVLIDEAQPQVAVKPDVYVENGYLVFKDYETLDSLKKELNSMSFASIQNFETEFGFKSAYSHRKELLKRADELPELEIENYLNDASKTGYFDIDKKEFVYPFYNESYAQILNHNGRFKIGNIIYQFKGDVEIVKLDVTGIEYNGNQEDLTKEIQLNSGSTQLKSGEMVKESMLSDNRLRCLLQLKRENFALSGYVIEDGRIIWGTLGYYWAVYYRFYSYKQYLFYKSDRPTYFNWKTKQTQIGGNNNYWYLNYYNANPYTERSTQQASIIHYHIYETSLTASGISPTISAVQVSDFWSDYMSSFHGSLIYQ